jgi:hypothetical protein
MQAFAHLIVIAALLALPRPALAAKWHGCPADPQPVYPSSLGATNAPFAHPGHELRILLNQAQVGSGGGFATTADNLVQIELATLFGDRIALAPRQVAAVSPSVLAITFPDTTAEVGRPLSGPVEIRVLRGDRLVARIDPAHLVALPPRTDVTGLLTGTDPNQVVHAALGATGDLWVPASFNGKPMPMPGCPGDLMMPMQVQVGAASIPGLTALRRGPLDRIRRISLYFGDVAIDGNSFYGALSPQRIPLVHVGGSRGVSICQMNDALDVVLRVKGNRPWARSRRSPLAGVARDAAPIPLLLRAAKPMPEKASVPWDEEDTFGNTCETTPVIDARGGGEAPGRPSPQP